MNDLLVKDRVWRYLFANAMKCRVDLIYFIT